MKRPLQVQPGGRNPRARWTDEEAEDLREQLAHRLAKGDVTYKELGEEIGCSGETVRLLVKKQRYRGR